MTIKSWKQCFRNEIVLLFEHSEPISISISLNNRYPSDKNGREKKSQNLLELQPSLQKQRSKNYFLEPKLQRTLVTYVRPLTTCNDSFLANS